MNTSPNRTPLSRLMWRRLLAGTACAGGAFLAAHSMAEAPAKPGKGAHATASAKSGGAKPASTKTASKAAPAKANAPAKQALSLTLNAEQRAVLYRALAEAEQEGFGAEEFAPSNLGEMLASKDRDELTRAQDLLVQGVVRYARAQHGLRSFHGDEWPKEWALRPQAYDAERDLSFAVKENRLQDWVNSLPPPFARYRVLKAALATLRTEAARPAPASATAGRSKTAKGKLAKAKGAKRAPAAATGDGAPKSSASVTLSRDEQVRTLIANMERWRWMPRNIAPDRVEVNSAAGLLQVFQNGQPTLAMKAAAGKPGDETPMLASAIDSIVFNPAWHIPKSIAQDELIPKSKRNPSYFKKEGIVYSKETESGLLQKPGPKNALGQIKFDFKNPFAVYLHDTPAQAAFDRASRNVSHGCVRVEKPVDLAVLLLQGVPEGSPEAIQSMIGAAEQPAPVQTKVAKGKGVGKADSADQTAEIVTKRVETPKPMPVLIAYWTAFAGEGDKVEFRKDVYGWDAKLLQLLAAGSSAT